jgi:hypothetical protein
LIDGRIRKTVSEEHEILPTQNWNAIIADCEYMKRLHVYVLVHSISFYNIIIKNKMYKNKNNMDRSLIVPILSTDR